jgi:hypothetical protein
MQTVETYGFRKREGCKTGKSFGVVPTPQVMPMKSLHPVFDLLRANSVKA